jgi:hypothetical protein
MYPFEFASKFEYDVPPNVKLNPRFVAAESPSSTFVPRIVVAPLLTSYAVPVPELNE